MSDLSEAQLRMIDERLAAREIELRARVRAAKEEAAERPSAQGPQVDDIGEDGEERFRSGIEHVELARDQEELADIADARTRIANGLYGDCVDCGAQHPRIDLEPFGSWHPLAEHLRDELLT